MKTLAIFARAAQYHAEDEAPVAELPVPEGPAAFLANAVRVSLEDTPIRNAFKSDKERKAFFARQGGGGSRSGIVKKDPAKDFRQGGSGDLNKDSQNKSGPKPDAYAAVGGGGNFTQAANPKYDTPAWKEWKSTVQAAMARAPGGYTDKAGFHASDGTFIPSPQESASGAGGTGRTPPPGGDNLFAGGNPYFDERTGKYLTDAQRADKDRQMNALMRALATTSNVLSQPQPSVPSKPFDVSAPPAKTPEQPVSGGSPNMPPQGPPQIAPTPSTPPVQPVVTPTVPVTPTPDSAPVAPAPVVDPSPHFSVPIESPSVIYAKKKKAGEEALAALAAGGKRVKESKLAGAIEKYRK